jgi:hypothetical protein
VFPEDRDSLAEEVVEDAADREERSDPPQPDDDEHAARDAGRLWRIASGVFHQISLDDWKKRFLGSRPEDARVPYTSPRARPNCEF